MIEAGTRIPDHPCNDGPLMNPDPDLVAEFPPRLPFGLEGIMCFPHRERSPQRANGGRLLPRPRRVENRLDRISDEPVDDPAERFDRPGHPFHVGIQKPEDRLGRLALGNRCEAPDIRSQHHNFLQRPPHRFAVASPRNYLHDLGGDETAHPFALSKPQDHAIEVFPGPSQFVRPGPADAGLQIAPPHLSQAFGHFPYRDGDPARQQLRPSENQKNQQEPRNESEHEQDVQLLLDGPKGNEADEDHSRKYLALEPRDQPSGNGFLQGPTLDLAGKITNARNPGNNVRRETYILQIVPGSPKNGERESILFMAGARFLQNPLQILLIKRRLVPGDADLALRARRLAGDGLRKA